MPALFSFTLISPTGSTSSASSTTIGAAAGAQAIRDFALDPTTGDLMLVDGDLQTVAGAEGVASDLAARLQTFKGECFLNTAIGIDYFGEVLGKVPVPRVEEILRTAILETPGVAGIDAFSILKSGRSLVVSFRASTDFGEIIDASLNLET